MRINLLLLLFLFTATTGFAQTPADFIGKWDGSLDLPGRALQLHLTITEADEGLAIGLDVPQQNIVDMDAANVSQNLATLKFKVPGVPGDAGWEGRFKKATDTNSLDSLVGTWSQAGRDMPLNFARPSGPLAGAELKKNIAQIETYATELLQRMNVPGAGIALIHGDEVIGTFGVGYSDLEAKKPATAQTVFAIGSSSKAFTSFGLGLLADRGKLDWEQPVIEYLPDFRMHDDFATHEMTAVDLLTHRSGLPRHDLLWYLNNNLTRHELYQRLRYLEPTKSFRSAWQYQNLMYMTAGVLTEKISGQTWEDFTRQHIFEPLGMTSANFDINSLPSLPDFAYGYGENKDEVLEKLPYHPLPAIGPAGSINANAADMAKWVSMHLNGGKIGELQLIGPETLKELHRPRISIGNGINGGVSLASYALGWIVYDWNGNYIVEHGGNIDGFSALVYMAPEENLGFVILTNKNGTEYGSVLARYALNLLLGEEAEDFYTDSTDKEEEEEADEEEKDSSVSPFADTKFQHALADYVGVYLDKGYGAVTVTEKDGQLNMAYGDLNMPLQHRHFETFRASLTVPEMIIDLNFITAINGKVNAVEIDAEAALGHPTRFEKQPDAGMTDAAYLDRLAGKYLLEGEYLTISRVGERLTLKVPGQPVYELEAAANNEFKLTIASGYSVEFHLEKEKVVALTLHQPNGDFRAERE